MCAAFGRPRAAKERFCMNLQALRAAAYLFALWCVPTLLAQPSPATRDLIPSEEWNKRLPR